MENSNLTIWESLKKTDPKYTKNAKVKGGFNITAINATYQAQQMTKTFGVYGIGWGLENATYKVVKLSDDSHDSILVFKADLFYILNDKKGVAPIDAELDIWIYSIKYKSWSKNNDTYKKVKTDAMTKGFSLLGLSADVFMGLYDDNKYINEVRHELEEKKPTVKPVDPKSIVTEITTKLVRAYLTAPQFAESVELKDMKTALNNKSLLANQYLVDELIKEYGSLNA